MIGLKQLIQVAPFPEESKQKLLQDADNLSSDKQFDLMQTCWELISADYQNKVSFEVQKMTLEMAEGTKLYEPSDFKKVEDDLFNNIVTKLEALGNDDKIEEIRKQINSEPNQPITNPAGQ